jgi:hypothetical protein
MLSLFTVIARLVRATHPKVVPHQMRRRLGLGGPDKPGHDGLFLSG